MKYKKYLPTVFLALLCAVVPTASVPDDSASALAPFASLLYHFTHANVWHFLLNFIFLARFCPRWTTVGASYFIASACTEMPFIAVSLPTCGISAMCFAMIARRDAAWNVKNYPLILSNLALAFFPMFNWKLHIAAYIISFVIWKVYYLRKNNQ